MNRFLRFLRIATGLPIICGLVNYANIRFVENDPFSLKDRTPLGQVVIDSLGDGKSLSPQTTWELVNNDMYYNEIQEAMAATTKRESLQLQFNYLNEVGELEDSFGVIIEEGSPVDFPDEIDPNLIDPQEFDSVDFYLNEIEVFNVNSEDMQDLQKDLAQALNTDIEGVGINAGSANTCVRNNNVTIQNGLDWNIVTKSEDIRAGEISVEEFKQYSGISLLRYTMIEDSEEIVNLHLSLIQPTQSFENPIAEFIREDTPEFDRAWEVMDNFIEKHCNDNLEG